MEFFDITFALTGDPVVNSRALRQLRILAGLGANILVLGITDDSPPPNTNISKVTFRYLPKPVGNGPRFFFQIHQNFKYALRNITSKIYHASDLYSLPATAKASSDHQAKLVFDSRELYTHLPASIRRPWVRAVWSIIEHRYIQSADCVFTVSESISKHLMKSYNLDSIHVMLNVPAPQKKAPIPSIRERLGIPSNKKIILHQGSLQKYRGASMMVKAMRHTQDAILVFMGRGPLRAETEQLVLDLNLSSKVRFLDPVLPDDLLHVTATADVGLTFLEDCCLNHRYALPNKFFEYLTAGIPVIASNLPEIARIIERFDVGCVVPSGDAKALGIALNAAIQNPDQIDKWRKNTSYVKERFNFAIESQNFLAPYCHLLQC